MQEGADFGRRRHRLVAAAQHQHIGIRQDAEPGLVAAVERAAGRASRIVEFAHAEEGEIVVAQPFEEGDRFRDRILVERHRRIAEIGDRAVETGQHRLPVLDRRPHLAEHLAEPDLQPFGPVLRQPADMHLDDADAFGVRIVPGGLAENFDDA